MMISKSGRLNHKPAPGGGYKYRAEGEKHENQLLKLGNEKLRRMPNGMLVFRNKDFLVVRFFFFDLKFRVVLHAKAAIKF